MDSNQQGRYSQRGVSAAKEDVHNAIKNIDKGPRVDTDFHNARDSVHLQHEVQHIN